MKINENQLKKSMKINEDQWKSMKINENQRKSMKINENQRKTKKNKYSANNPACPKKCVDSQDRTKSSPICWTSKHTQENNKLVKHVNQKRQETTGPIPADRTMSSLHCRSSGSSLLWIFLMFLSLCLPLKDIFCMSLGTLVHLVFFKNFNYFET